MAQVQFKPDGYHTVTPFIYNSRINDIVAFARSAFGAREREMHYSPDGSLMHGEIQIGDSIIMLSEAKPDMPPMPVMLYLYVENCDELYANAIAAGAESLRVPTNEFYGDRSCGVKDIGGNQWWLATHVEDVSPEELMKRMEAFMSTSGK